MVLIENSRVIVTGGAQGIGLEFCHDLLYHGTKALAILDINIKSGEDNARFLNCLYEEAKVIFIPTDVSDKDEFERHFKFAVTQIGGLDIMINNAAIMNDAKWSLAIDTNLKGVIQGTLMAIDVMGKHKGGRGGTVINMGSVASFNAGTLIPIYCTTKAAIVHFTRCLANSYNVHGVEIKGMCPSATGTGLIHQPPENFLEIFYKAQNDNRPNDQPTQKPDKVSESTMRLIQEAPNGAVWAQLRDLPLSEIKFPTIPDLVVPLRSQNNKS